MYFKPHRLQKRVKPQYVNDEYGRPVPIDESENWEDVCMCRCDHNVSEKVELPDGTIIKPKYSVVCDGNNPDIEVDDYVRCLREDGTIRGEGKVCNPQFLNYLPYAKIYLQV